MQVPTGSGNVCCLRQTGHTADITKPTRLTRSRHTVRRFLLNPQLTQCAKPILHMIGLGNLAVANGLHVDGHDSEALSGMRSTEEHARWGTSHLAADDHSVARNEDFVNLKLQIRN